MKQVQYHTVSAQDVSNVTFTSYADIIPPVSLELNASSYGFGVSRLSQVIQWFYEFISKMARVVITLVCYCFPLVRSGHLYTARHYQPAPCTLHGQGSDGKLLRVT